ncbi:hypothetical protein ACFYU8_14750 [Brevibacillus sp. NPDC003359]|uniref:hypothetical protein n=1 Tax=unclassified Brevibacillus TaxID=2684853 RepID=UPI003699C365
MTLFLSGFFLSLSLCLDLGIVNVGMSRESIRPKVILDTDQPSQLNGSLAKDFGRGLGLALASPSALLWFVTVGGNFRGIISLFCGQGFRRWVSNTSLIGAIFRKPSRWRFLFVAGSY